MYKINDTINLTSYKGLKAGKLLDVKAKETLLISLEKDAVFPEHTSPTNAHLLVLEGLITIYINDLEFKLTKHQIFNFPKDKKHWVNAIEDSKFLIIR